MAHEAQMIEYSDLPAVLIVADAEASALRARRSAELSGCRIIDSIPVSGAVERLSRQAAADAVIIEVEADHGDMLIGLLDAVEAAAEEGRHGSVVSAPASMIDLIAARTRHRRVVHLCDASELERVAAIGLVSARQKHRLHDISKEEGPPGLGEISDQVGRIANLLASLSAAEEDIAAIADAKAAEDEGPSVTAGDVRAVIRARRMREQFFGPDLFSDPAWDILLDLYAARLENRRVAVSSLCIAAAVPSTTALRWIKSLTDVGLLDRIADPQDGRRVYIELAPETALRLNAYFRAVQRLSPLGI